MIFIAYSRADREFVFPLAKFLRASGHAVFVDTEDLPYGDDWRQTVAAALAEASRCLVFWSAASSKSPQVKDEIELALRNPACSVVPVLLDGPPLPESISRLHGASELAPLVRKLVRAKRLYRLMHVIAIGLALGMATFTLIVTSRGPEQLMIVVVFVALATALWLPLMVIPASYYAFVLRPRYKRLASRLQASIPEAKHA